MRIELTAQDGATPKLQDFLDRLKSGAALQAMATAVKVDVQNNFLRLEGRGNKMGWPSQHLYARAARSTNSRVANHVAMVSINQLEIAQRYFGGDITPGKNVSRATGRLTQYLTIAARPEAYGKRAGEFDDLEVLWGRNGPYALAERQYTEVSFGKERKGGSRAVKKGEEHGVVLYWLTDFVHQEPDPTVLPDAEEMSNAALNAGESWMQRNANN